MRIKNILLIGFIGINILTFLLWYTFFDVLESGAPLAIISGIALSFIFLFITSKSITNSIGDIKSSINEITDGNMNSSIGYGRISEVNSLADSLNKILISLKLAVMRIDMKSGLKDILKSKEDIEKRFKKYEDFVKTMIENSGIPIVAFKKDDGLLLANKEFLDMTGYAAEEIKSREEFFNNAFPAKLVRDKIKKELSDFYNGHKVNDFVIPIRRKDGSTIISVSNITQMHDGQGNPTGEAIFFRDLSEIFSLEEQIRFWAANGFVQVPLNKQHLPKIEISEPPKKKSKRSNNRR
ncbi:MAG TPA: PAS domain S-box protein [Candidatus Nanoarchaeia archaeon]|nr:PAS domain S-box protein [Candidatus Nanoarchaeia archaeon]